MASASLPRGVQHWCRPTSSTPRQLPARRAPDHIMATRRNIQYSHLPMEDINGDHASEEAGDDLRFTYTPKSHMRVPWKSIALALFLLLIGILLLSLSYFIFTNHMEADDSQAYGLLFLGVLAFLPGYYETRVAYYSWRGAQGYTFARIPDY